MIFRSILVTLIGLGSAKVAFSANGTCSTQTPEGGLVGNGRTIFDAKNRYSFRYPEQWKCKEALSSITVEETLPLEVTLPSATMFLNARMHDAKMAPTAYLDVDADKFVVDVRRIRSGTGGLATYLAERFPRENWQPARVSDRSGFQSIGLDTSRIYLPGGDDFVYVISNSVDRDGIPSAPLQMILGTFTILQ